MDTYGYITIAIGIVIWLVTRRRSQGWCKFGLWLFGGGVGLLIGVYGSFAVVMSALR